MSEALTIIKAAAPFLVMLAELATAWMKGDQKAAKAVFARGQAKANKRAMQAMRGEPLDD